MGVLPLVKLIAALRWGSRLRGFGSCCGPLSCQMAGGVVVYSSSLFGLRYLDKPTDQRMKARSTKTNRRVCGCRSLLLLLPRLLEKCATKGTLDVRFKLPACDCNFIESDTYNYTRILAIPCN